MHFKHKEVTIGMPETPYMLRVNKQVGCFSIGNIEAGNIDSIQTFGRGKSLEFAIAACDTSLHGKIGKVKEEQNYAFVSAIVTNSDDARLPAGLLVHFLVYGYEARFFAMLAAELETSAIFGGARPQLIRMAFDKSIATQYGSTIKPPTILTKEATKEELPYFEAAQLIAEKYAQYLPDPTVLYPPTADPVTGEIVSGLIDRRNHNLVLTAAKPQMAIAGSSWSDEDTGDANELF